MEYEAPEASVVTQISYKDLYEKTEWIPVTKSFQ